MCRCCLAPHLLRMPLQGPFWLFKDLFYFSLNNKHTVVLCFKLLPFTFLSYFFSLLFPAYLAQGKHLTCSKAISEWPHVLEPIWKGKWWLNDKIHSVTKPCPCPSLGHDSLLYSFSPCISQHSPTSKWYLWSSQPFPAIYFCHHSKMRHKMKDVEMKEQERESSVPKQRWNAAEKPDHSHWYRHEQKTQLALSKKPLRCKPFLNM